jgi:hypothetical protein
MQVGKLTLFVCLCAFALPAFAGVTVTSPGNGTTVTSPVHFAATAASSSCSKGVAAMGIYTAPNVLAYKVNGASLNANIAMSSGVQYPVVQEWDNCGSSSTVKLKVTVGASTVTQSSGSSGKVFSNLQKSGGWHGYALLPPAFGICSGCSPTGSNVKWSWSQGVSSPSMDGISTRAAYNGGTTQWADILWNNHLIGDFSSQGLPDSGKTLIPTLHNFTYDVYFWIGNASNSQALEFDINQFVGGKSYIWGHECRIDGGHEWDTWSNPGGHWVASGIPCNPKSNAWNHLTIEVARTSDDRLLFKSITLNGYTATVSRYDTPTSTSWYGVTVNYQMDSDVYKTAYPVYLDKLTFSAW